MVDLSASRWANRSHRNANIFPPTQPQHSHSENVPASGAVTPNITQPVQLSKAQKDFLTRRSDAIKFAKLHRRLKWKSRTLLFSHHRALHQKQQNDVGGVGFPMEDGEAETMFKVDFFEFYVLLERVLVHLLGVFGMVVTAAYGGDTKPNTDGSRQDQELTTASKEPKSLREELMEQHRQRAIFGDSMMFHGYAHRFHANVLAALDLPSNPLYQYLGTGVVRDYLGIAKEFRNRWKDADEKPADERDNGLVGSRYEKMLQDLNLEEMLSMILIGIENAKPLAEAELNNIMVTIGGGDSLDEAMMEMDDIKNNTPWEYMPDAMDWD